ncbi:MAG: adenosylmethionine--8-amino-7-oxononanoate transaminase [Planctomycetota bacterium]|nr:adenosylmethionine--8-amino-7-oxononanoate transaminase [Planctomycetota bacterium]
MSAPWWERDGDVCWHPYTQHGVEETLLPVTGAQGAWLELADGRRMLDAVSSWWACLHGHGHPRLVEAIATQAATLDHVLFAGCTHEPAVRLAERLAAAAPAGLTRTFFSDDGSTAVEVALKACYSAAARRGEKERTLFVALEGGYHGDTFGAMAVGDPDPFFDEFGSLLFRVVRAPPDAAALEALMAEHGAQTAALILEPIVQGAAGMQSVAPDVVRAARRLCDEHGAFLVADEVMTGFGRTGTLFACEQAGISPDALCLSKGLTGGMLPLSATLFTESIFEAFRSEDRGRMFFHGHTYTGHAIGCAVALASLDVVEADDTPARFEAIGARVSARLDALLPDDGSVQRRRFGGIVVVELDGDGGYLDAAGPRLKAACRTHAPDVLLRPLGSVLYSLPPACTTMEECDLIAERMAAVLTAAR